MTETAFLLLWAGGATVAAFALFVWGAERGQDAARHADDCDERIGEARYLARKLLDALGPKEDPDE